MKLRKPNSCIFDLRSRGGSLLAAIPLLLSLAVPARAATHFVDPGDAQCSDLIGAPFCTLAGALDIALDDDLIVLAAGTYAETASVSQNITIRGAGAGTTTVDGAGLGPVFDLLGDVTLERLTITGGSQMIFGGGGGIRSSGNARVTDCLVTGNTGAGGGGIKQEGGTLELVRTEVSNNTSDAPNIAGGAGIWTAAGDLEIIDSRIADNHNLNDISPGGGLKFEGGVASLLRTTVSGNTSLNNFGGIGAFGSSMTLTDSTVSDNEAAANLGGVGGLGSNITLINTTVSGNRAQFTAGVFLGVCCGGRLTLRNVTVFGNESSSSSTGGVNFESTSTVSTSILAGNTNALGASDCSGTLDSRGYNLIQSVGCAIVGNTTGNMLGIDPSLLPLAANGGPTQTHALPTDSPALDAGNPAVPGSSDDACEETDQRGFARPLDGDGDRVAVCDIGAFELSLLIFVDGFESGDMSAW